MLSPKVLRQSAGVQNSAEKHRILRRNFRRREVPRGYRRSSSRSHAFFHTLTRTWSVKAWKRLGNVCLCDAMSNAGIGPGTSRRFGHHLTAEFSTHTSRNTPHPMPRDLVLFSNHMHALPWKRDLEEEEEPEYIPRGQKLGVITPVVLAYIYSTARIRNLK